MHAAMHDVKGAMTSVVHVQTHNHTAANRVFHDEMRLRSRQRSSPHRLTDMASAASTYYKHMQHAGRTPRG